MKDYLRNGYFHHEEAGVVAHYDQATFHKNKTGLHIKGGINLLAFNRFTLDGYAGLGIAYRKIYYADVVNSAMGDYRVFEEWWGHGYKYQGNSLLFHLALGMKAGLILWKK